MEKEVLTTREAAALLGTSVESVRRRARSGSLPGERRRMGWRFRRSDLGSWMQEQQAPKLGNMVLIVDDEEAVRHSVRKAMLSAGYRVEEASSGREALVRIDQECPSAILLDLSMPGMGGPELLGILRRDHAEIPVVVLTGFPEGELMEGAMRHGPLTLLAKPTPVAQLLRAVGTALGSQDSRY